MPDKKLFTKLDEALACVKKHNKQNYYWACDFVSALLPRLRTNKPFDLHIGDSCITVKPNDVKVSKTTIDFGTRSVCLVHICPCVTGHDKDGHKIEAPSILLMDGRLHILSVSKD